ncbi:MAG: TorF family putative porin [Thiothrix sp.]|uniref:TorF family putative porin n=1 Tax=Thiothrix sp. TaxID=1032 RepID=UPI00260446EC|nr:TorF family putative porin [Thiothrix sp.]MDD5393668.1 TorF family putative porin [Thiothrix sp.]
MLAAAVLGTLSANTQVLAGASGSVAVTSNYVARGLTQTQDDEAALQGTFNYTTQSGLYGEVFGSNVKFNGIRDTEIDLSAGYKKDLENGLGYDVGVVKYVYPEHSSPDYSEAYGKLSYKGWGAEAYYTVDSKDATNAVQKGDVYYALGYNGELPNNWGYGVQVGHDNFKAADADYDHAQVSLTKSLDKMGDLALVVDHADTGIGTAPNGTKENRASLTWTKNF